jgi:hypothetical protein
MNRHDQELLATQMRTISPPASEGVAGVMIATAFCVGVVLGGVLFAYHGDRTHIDPQLLAALSPPNGAPPPTWQ